ncbi:unnamed protein product [Mycena citricolor]|uniref:Uncharacterized protein n=1 Tax=Mycena citricolor TaxID=2018698 RepID=A0AAD2K7Y4_9AGAR|nr:unnamed protein product [Mycena citricolor]
MSHLCARHRVSKVSQCPTVCRVPLADVGIVLRGRPGFAVSSLSGKNRILDTPSPFLHIAAGRHLRHLLSWVTSLPETQDHTIAASALRCHHRLGNATLAKNHPVGRKTPLAVCCLSFFCCFCPCLDRDAFAQSGSGKCSRVIHNFRR